MSLFYLTAASIGYWTQLALVLIVTGYFVHLVWRAWRQGERPIQTLLMTCFAASAVCLMSLLFLEVSVHPNWRWQMVFLQNIAVSLCLLFLLQFAYRFPFLGARQKRESYVVLGLSLLYLLWETWLAVHRFQLLGQGRIMLRPRAADYPMVAGTVWALVTLLRQAVRMSTGAQGQSWWRRLLRPQGRPARSARAIALVSLFFLVPTVVDVIPGYLFVYPGTHELVFSLSMLSALFVFVMVYLDYLPQRTSFMAKLSGASLVIVLAVLGSAGWMILPPFLADYGADSLIQGQRALRFVPNEQGGYDVRAAPSTFDGPRGEAVELHPSKVYHTSLPFPFPFYGQTWQDLYVGENGWVTVDSALSAINVTVRYGSRPAILALFAHQLQIDRADTPANGPSSGIYLDVQMDRFTITWYRMVDQTAPHRRYTFQLVLYADGAFDVTHSHLASVPAAEIYVEDRSNWIVGAVPGGRRGAPAQLDLATDLPYLDAGQDGIVSDPYMCLRGALHRRMLPLLHLIAASSGLVLVGFPLFFYFSLIRPLDVLLAGIRRVNAGDLGVEMPVQHQDEIGLLTESFNRMIADLRGLVNELELRVAERTRELSVLYEVAAVASSSPDLQTTLLRSLEQVLQAVGCEEGVIHLLDDEARAMQLVVQQGLPDDIVPQVASLYVGGTEGWGDERGETVFVPDVASDPDQAHPLRARRYVGIPMRAGGQVVGLLGVLREMAQPRFSAEEIALLVSVADQVGAVAESARLRQQAERAAVMEERQRLARDLHDSVTQSLYSLTLLIEGGRRLVSAGQVDGIEDYFVELGEIALQSLKEMRLLIYELRPPVLEQEGLVGALQRRLDIVEGRAGVEARLLMVGDGLEDGARMELPALMEQELYGIAQEALNNALKHAAATSITVWLRADGGRLELEVADNGRGFDPERAVGGGGIGLSTMRERAERLGGSLDIQSAPGEGTRIKASIEAWENP